MPVSGSMSAASSFPDVPRRRGECGPCPTPFTSGLQGTGGSMLAPIIGDFCSARRASHAPRPACVRLTWQTSSMTARGGSCSAGITR
jgi:hypothetical protein